MTWWRGGAWAGALFGLLIGLGCSGDEGPGGSSSGGASAGSGAAEGSGAATGSGGSDGSGAATGSGGSGATTGSGGGGAGLSCPSASETSCGDPCTRAIEDCLCRCGNGPNFSNCFCNGGQWECTACGG